MATTDNEYYWRIYLLHHEGSTLISKQVISREVVKCGDDIDSLLLKNKQRLNKIVSTSEADILFPKCKKTDTEQWEADLFPRVILTLFSKTLPQTERQHIRGIQNVQKEFASLPEPSLDPETYGDLTESLSKALRELARALSKGMETKITELVNDYINQPFNVADMLNNIQKFNLRKNIEQKLKIYLVERMSVSEEETGAGVNETSQDASPPAKIEIARVDVSEGTRDAHPSLSNEITSPDVYEIPRNTAEVQTDTHLASANKHEFENKSRDTEDLSCGGKDDAKDCANPKLGNGGSSEIVIYARESLPAQEIRHEIRQMPHTDLGKNLNDKDITKMVTDKLKQMGA
ncbi:uncharacterized protein LOC128546810 [Mercenaria mercenaria]|uniref:uncharacterized protein LOC128546810 n=1 Tax=Mercenaria mercenaria TaxID=6596 RepID=UPI00234E9442|nr:uncharacterized protein LOC128546810 [Mercenaria mercenaria]